MSPREASRRLRIAAAVSVMAAGPTAALAWLHMRAVAQAYGVICGSGAGQLAHCPACYVSVALLALGLGGLALSHVPQPARPRVRTGS